MMIHFIKCQTHTKERLDLLRNIIVNQCCPRDTNLPVSVCLSVCPSLSFRGKHWVKSHIPCALTARWAAPLDSQNAHQIPEL